MLVIKVIKAKAINTFMVQNNGASEDLAKAVADFMSVCVCGLAILEKGDGEPSIVALQDAVKNSKQSGTILENSSKGDSQSNRAEENAVREAEGLTRTRKMSVEEKWKAVMDIKHVILPWLVMHEGAIITRYKTVDDGMTAYDKIKH